MNTGWCTAGRAAAMRRPCRSLSAGIIIEALAGVGEPSYISIMAQMNVLLPDDLQHWTDARAAEGGFDSGGDYVRDLLRRDREYAEKLAILQAAIDEGLASGVSDRDPFEYLEELRAGLRERARSANAA